MGGSAGGEARQPPLSGRSNQARPGPPGQFSPDVGCRRPRTAVTPGSGDRHRPRPRPESGRETVAGNTGGEGGSRRLLDMNVSHNVAAQGGGGHPLSVGRLCPFYVRSWVGGTVKLILCAILWTHTKVPGHGKIWCNGHKLSSNNTRRCISAVQMLLLTSTCNACFKPLFPTGAI